MRKAVKYDALQLADDLVKWPYERYEAAAELRRLHAENERLRQINQSHEMKLSVRGYEIQIDDLKALNAELVEALTTCVMAMQDYQAGIGITEMFDKGERMARAVLAKCEVSNEP